MADNIKNTNPWKAFLPYDEESAHQFKGRAENVEELFNVILKERTTVCYADSGVGKSSLINAGLKPKLRSQMFFPVDIVFAENDLSSEFLDFDKLLIQTLRSEIKLRNKRNKDVKFKLERSINIHDSEISKLNRELSFSSLWWLFHTHKISCTIKGIFVANFAPIFIFDQFEELFTKSHHESFIESFYGWFSSTMSDAIPESVKNKIKKLSHWTLLSESGITKEFDLKFLFSLRQDSIGTFDYWSTQRFSIPTLHRNRYCLLPLTTDQAKSVITDQGVDTLNEVAEEIIEELKETNSTSIPAIMLSVFCYKLYESAKVGNDGSRLKVNKEDISANKETLIREYYEELLKETHIDENIINIIEDCLVSETGKRNRIVNESSEKLNGIHFDSKYRKILTDKYLINDKKEYIEIAHDKLAEAIFVRKKDRKLKRSLRNWRFLFFTIPFALLLYSLCHVINPNNNPLSCTLHEYRSSEYFSPRNIGLENGTYNLNEKSVANSLFENILVDTIVNWKFKKCPNLRKIKVVNINEVGGKGLQIEECPNLECIDLSDDVTEIGSEFIVNCPSLKFLRISKQVKYIDEKAFISDNLSIEVDSENNRFIWDNGVLWDMENKVTPIVYIRNEILDQTKKIPFIEKYSGNDSVEYRGMLVYALDVNQSELFVNNDSTELRYSTLYKKYKSIDLSNLSKITYIPERLFKDCEYLEKILLPPNIDSIGNEAFLGCRKLTEIKFPKSLKKIGKNAFEGCFELEKIDFLGGRYNWVTIEELAFSCCNSLDSIILPYAVNKIGSGAFADCVNLQKVCIPVRLRILAPDVFLRCHSLNEFEQRNVDDDTIFRIVDGAVFAANDMIFWSTKKYVYKNDSIYSKNGIVYKGKSIQRFNKYSDFEEYKRHGGFDFGLKYFIFLDNLNDSIIYLPYRNKLNCVYDFIELPGNLNELHIKNPQPDGLVSNSSDKHKYYLSKVRINLPLHIRKNVILYVPYGCRDKYINHPDFQGYKSMMEDSLVLRIKDALEYFWICILNFYIEYPWMIGLSIVGVLVLCWFIYAIGHYSIDKIVGVKRSGEKAVLTAVVFTFFFTPICFMGSYWIAYIRFSISSLSATLIGIAFCCLAVTFLSVMQRMTPKEVYIKRNEFIKYLWDAVKCNWKKLLKVLVCFIVFVISYYCYDKYNKELDNYRTNIIEKCERLRKSTNPLKAYSLAYKYLTKQTFIKNISINYVNFLRRTNNRSLSACFSPDGKYVLTSPVNNTAILWDALTYEVIDTLQGHSDWITSACFSPDGKYIVTASHDKTSMLWNTETCEVIDTLQGHSDRINSACFSPDGKYIATASDDNIVMIWDAVKLGIVDTLKGHRNDVSSVNFSPDGKSLLTTSCDYTAMLWDVPTFEVLDTLKGHDDMIRSACFSPNGKYIITIPYDKEISLLWDVSSCKVITALVGHDEWIRSASFSPCGKYIVTTSDDNSVLFWEMELLLNEEKWYEFAQEVSKKYPLTDEEIDELGFNYDVWAIPLLILGILVVIILCYVIIRLDWLRLFRVLTRKQWMMVLGAIMIVCVIYCIVEYKVLQKEYQQKIVCQAQTLYDKKEYDEAVKVIVEGLSSRMIKNDSIAKSIIKYYHSMDLKGHRADINSAIFSPDGNYIVTIGSSDKTALLWSVGDSCCVIDTLKGHSYGVASASFSPDGNYIVTIGRWDKAALLWSVGDSCRVIDTIKGHRGSINSASFSPDGNYIVTASDDKTALLWSVDDFCCVIDTLKGHSYGVASASFSPDGNYIVTTGRWDKTALLWSVGDSCCLIDTLKGHRDKITSASFSPDGNYIVTTETSYFNDKTVLLWSVGDSCYVIETSKGHSFGITSADFSPDGNYIVTTGRYDNTALLWSVGDSCCVVDALKGHRDNITSASFSPDSNYIITISNDKTAKIWFNDLSLLIEHCRNIVKKEPLSEKTREKYGIKWWMKL